jgi:lipoprotein-anchoring transpeptidase ErfK/SrfK
MDDMELKEDRIEPSAVTPEVSVEDTVADAVPEQEAGTSVDATVVFAGADEAPAETIEVPVVVADGPTEPADEPAVSPAVAPTPAVAPAATFAYGPAEAPASRVGTWFKLAFLIVFVVLSLGAIVGDYVALAYVPRGVTLLGRDVGNLSTSALRTAIDRNVATPAMQPLTVLGDSKSWQLDPRGIVTVDVNAMVAQAYAPAHKATMLTRLWSRITGAPLRAEVKPVYSVDSASLQRWVAETAATVERPAIDATRSVVKYTIKITPEVMGAAVDESRAVDVISAALTAEESLTTASRTASLPIDFIAPKVTTAKFKKAIVVSLSKTTVYLYDGAKLIKTYRCAPGQPAWPTPKGDFVIIRKQANAPWINPGSSWAASMPHIIPGGPGNPMGDRKIGINWPGVFLHGIPPSEYSSIGTHASHGCMRMMPASIHDLYPRVRVGDPVYIRS